MNYEQIKADVEAFKESAMTAGLMGYCAIGSLLLTCCLNDHGIQSELVKGYIIADDKYWALHIWNKIYIDGKVHQIDVVQSPLQIMGIKRQYSLTLCDKWESLIDTKEEQDDYDKISKFYSIYKEHGTTSALAYFSANRTNVDVFKLLFIRLSKLKTFSTILNYKYILM